MTKQTETKTTRGPRVRNAGQVKRKAANAVEAQKVINKDYKALARDYGVLFRKIWQIPPTKYVIGGAVLASLIPLTKKLIRNFPEISDLVRENIDHVEEKFDEITNGISSKVSTLKGDKRDDLSDKNH